MMKKKTLILGLLAIMLLTAACGPKSRRDEIEQRKEALKHKQDSTLLASQQELAWVDSALQVATARHQHLLDELKSGRYSGQQLQQLGEQLTLARLERDSLKVRFEVLCGTIKYIHRKQQEGL
ncbi:MAG: hypothetical protein IKZ48_03550 [Prevotella sp.]|nr:hypothetical protein [Prevotella sp.]